MFTEVFTNCIKYVSKTIYVWRLCCDGKWFNPIQDGPPQDYSQMGDKKRPPIPKICHTYPAMMKLDKVTLPKEHPKNT